MIESNILDIEGLLQPISAELSSGKNLREDISPSSLYYQIKDARSAARSIERQAMEGEGSLSADKEWDTVYQLAINIFTNHSKDLEITAWFIEALLRKYDFAGLQEGFIFASRLIDQFWDSMYPEPDEDGVVTRIAALSGLNGEGVEGTLIVPIMSVNITESPNNKSFASWQYQQALEISRISDPNKREKRISSGGVALKEINDSVSKTSKTFFEDILKDVQGCLEAFSQLTATLKEKCGKDAPPSTRIQQALETCLGYIKNLGKDKLISPQKQDISDNAFGEQNGLATTFDCDASGVGGREKAFQQILKIAQFFRETEPHSPLSYILEKAVCWGKMSLPKLLDELITDDQTRGQLFRLTGIEDVEKEDS